MATGPVGCPRTCCRYQRPIYEFISSVEEPDEPELSQFPVSVLFFVHLYSCTVWEPLRISTTGFMDQTSFLTNLCYSWKLQVFGICTHLHWVRDSFSDEVARPGDGKVVTDADLSVDRQPSCRHLEHSGVTTYICSPMHRYGKYRQLTLTLTLTLNTIFPRLHKKCH